MAPYNQIVVSMISKLEAEAQAEATEKAYCDEQIAKTESKKAELEADIAKLTSKIDTAAARSAGLKEDAGLIISHIVYCRLADHSLLTTAQV